MKPLLRLPTAIRRRPWGSSRNAGSPASSSSPTKAARGPHLLGRARSGELGSDGSPIDALGKSESVTVDRRSFVLEHSGSRDLRDVYDMENTRELGVGGFGTVHRVSLKGATSVLRAVKSVKKASLKAESCVRREIAILRCLDHPCICRLLETFEDHRHIYLVLELIDGRELFDEIVERGSLDENRSALIMQQVLSGLQYCHDKNVVHRDLKPENIMVQRDHVLEEGGCSVHVPEVKIIDFGLAVVNGNSARRASGSLGGSRDYMAPEVRRGQTCFQPASDIWSAGMVLHALLLGGLPPFKVLIGEEPVGQDGRWDGVSPAAQELLRQMLQVQPGMRCTAKQAAEHHWTRGHARLASSPEQVANTMASFAAFHKRVKLQRAALTALAMQLTNQQLSDVREQFLCLDSDGNGTISKEELLNNIEAIAPSSVGDVREWAESVFDSIDTDGSKEIDYTEWVAAAMNESLFRSEEAIRAAFRVFDADGDGRIDTAEFARVLKQSPQEIAALMPQFDTNGDGVLDFNEFKNLFLRLPHLTELDSQRPHSHRGPEFLCEPRVQAATTKMSL
mmetsp:Transcript_133923/g.244273  ORF Transcript_133923/g.244273 Transcript_133923/m.244273 type:complete len:565 (+) Transcript_133923:56-1750(+)